MADEAAVTVGSSRAGTARRVDDAVVGLVVIALARTAPRDEHQSP
jgi:hypothetical protein